MDKKKKSATMVDLIQKTEEGEEAETIGTTTHPEKEDQHVAAVVVEEEDVATATAEVIENVTTAEEKEEDYSAAINKNKKYQKNKEKKNNNNNSDEPIEIPLPLTQDDPQKIIVDSILTHKRFSKVLEEWNEKVTEYRRWCMKLEQRNGRMNPFGEDAIVVSSKRSKKNKNKNNKKAEERKRMHDNQGGLQGIVDNESSLFCTLGGNVGGDDDDDGDDDRMEEDGMMAASSGGGKYDKYGPAGVDGFVPLKKKNRQGQRGRRAKALAIEAKKRGDKSRGTYQQNQYTSTNWREPKIRTENDDRDNTGGGGRKIGSKVGSRGRGKEQKRNNDTSTNTSTRRQYNTTDTSGGRNDTTNSNQPDATNEQQHPSWAAKQSQSTGIVAFQGKKITF